jgi:hypothetical protein
MEATTWQWSPEVLAFAREKGVADYLEPLREATQRLFPTALRLDVSVEADAENPEIRHIVFECWVKVADVPDYLAARRRWSDVCFGIVPAPRMPEFIFHLSRVKA